MVNDGLSVQGDIDVTAGNVNANYFVGTGSEFTGIVSATGNITGGNIRTAGIVSATANITGGNLNTGAQVIATGNVIGGSILTAGAVYARNATAIPAGGTTGVGITMSSTANFGVFFGSGAPILSAAKGSLYLRSDGSTTNDRMYVNTDGATGWTAVITAT
jgi:hypothetical protein